MAVLSALSHGERGADLALEEVEVALLQSLARQMIDFVSPDAGPDDDPLVAMVGIDPSAETPEDPALRRLLPDAFIDDDAAAAEFRRFTERDLRAAKADKAQRVLEALGSGDGRVRIAGEDVNVWLGFLNDTRLTLGARLELTEDSHDMLASLPEDDPRSGLFQVYDWLTFLQESLVQRLLPSS